MKSIESTIAIPASASAVWDTLLDTDRYPQWNPFITSVSGTVGTGQRLLVRIAPPGGRAMTFKPTVTVVETGHRLEWLGRMGVPGLFDGRHSFTLESVDDTTWLVQAEEFSGVLTPVAGKLLRHTAAGFAAMNIALRDRVVAQAAVLEATSQTPPNRNHV
jgi:hypothetical protein